MVCLPFLQLSNQMFSLKTYRLGGYHQLHPQIPYVKIITPCLVHFVWHWDLVLIINVLYQNNKIPYKIHTNQRGIQVRGNVILVGNAAPCSLP